MYFDYFNIIDLMGSMPDGTKAIEIKEGINASVTVTLKIPIQAKKYITYSRIYKRAVQEHQLAEPDIDRNVGAIIENRFNITIYPFLKSTQGTPSYRVGHL
jgi:anaerobic glycerol-3-phosphate dehydrogenase